MKYSKVFHMFLLLLFFHSKTLISNDRAFGMYLVRTKCIQHNKINYAVQLETCAISFKFSRRETQKIIHGVIYVLNT